ncbi:TetR/AcrR family transcriptional regulator [Streptomyces europaeiscabiei]|uniref:TetR/AcrR family transcriptional regulator n=1 Tax=Streptomyces TaxID=1883 RepID=UPI000A393068|nr:MULTISPECIES: TetR/AcrR family transcriptional regulator [Streptomyces]MDX3580988.1 TetR/AcrR family transcriptional regulator [Streptomyces europaeiscabiei]MDX3614780.1 TetR/AcrR family transcriptional regulator [Streptomyces europaeiscabiei]MDX3631098.1 TetR/AcrR family transcriptional regulator [Streptomyces europaeiscabiei]MDX3648888.1 TetR/AcrR family transcriptional regulator [Streptomyces europaeiscabiei]
MTTRVPQERRRRRPTRSGVLLSEDLIVQTALRLIGEHGPEALSVRRLGTALGCDPSALYRYFRDTDDLVLAIADRIIGDAMAGFAPGGDWVAALREMALRVRDGYLAHPRAAAFASYRVTRRPNEIRAVDTGIGLLLSAGFGPADATRLYLAFIDTVLSHAAMDAAYQALPRGQREADDRAWQDVYQGLDPESYPALSAVCQDLRTAAKSSFEDAVDLLLEALAARAPERRPEGRASRASGPAGT